MCISLSHYIANIKSFFVASPSGKDNTSDFSAKPYFYIPKDIDIGTSGGTKAKATSSIASYFLKSPPKSIKSEANVKDEIETQQLKRKMKAEPDTQPCQKYQKAPSKEKPSETRTLDTFFPTFK